MKTELIVKNSPTKKIPVPDGVSCDFYRGFNSTQTLAEDRKGGNTSDSFCRPIVPQEQNSIFSILPMNNWKFIKQYHLEQHKKIKYKGINPKYVQYLCEKIRRFTSPSI
jgi:hypothetical protein